MRIWKISKSYRSEYIENCDILVRRNNVSSYILGIDLWYNEFGHDWRIIRENYYKDDKN